MKNNNLPQHFVGFAIGLGIGAALGILFAPKSGEETREYLMDGANEAIDQVVTTGRRVTNRVASRARQAVNDVADRVSTVTDAGEDAFTKARSA